METLAQPSTSNLVRVNFFFLLLIANEVTLENCSAERLETLRRHAEATERGGPAGKGATVKRETRNQGVDRDEFDLSRVI